jgi:tetratricopeptide (TPR) repeat protein
MTFLFSMVWSLLFPLLAADPASTIPFSSDPRAQLVGFLMKNGSMNKPLTARQLLDVLQRQEAVYWDGGSRSVAAQLGSVLLNVNLSAVLATPAFDNLLYDLAGALDKEGAFGQSRKILLELIARKPPSSFRSPSFRKLVDITVSSGEYEQTLLALRPFEADLSTDEKDELAYLKGRALLTLKFSNEANASFDSITRNSRHRAAAMYLSGIIDLEQGKLPEGIEHFCDIVHQPNGGRFTFFLTAGTEQLFEHAWLALGRIRHDLGEFQRALDSYRQIQPASQSYTTARYESACALFRLGRTSEARAIFEELVQHSSGLPDLGNAFVMLGYSLLGECRYEDAKKLFAEKEIRWRLQAEILAQHFSNELPFWPSVEIEHSVPFSYAEERAVKLQQKVASSLGHTGWLKEQFESLASPSSLKKTNLRIKQLVAKLEGERSRAVGLRRKLFDLLLKQGSEEVPANTLREFEASETLTRQTIANIDRTLQTLQEGLITENAIPGKPAGSMLPTNYLDEENHSISRLAKELSQLLLTVKGQSALAEKSRILRTVEKLRHWSQLASLGQIDAVIGQKQALEAEVQHLAVGRYPFSIIRELAEMGALDESMEVWPYEGEEWPDEMP